MWCDVNNKSQMISAACDAYLHDVTCCIALCQDVTSYVITFYRPCSVILTTNNKWSHLLDVKSCNTLSRKWRYIITLYSPCGVISTPRVTRDVTFKSSGTDGALTKTFFLLKLFFWLLILKRNWAGSYTHSRKLPNQHWFSEALSCCN